MLGVLTVSRFHVEENRYILVVVYVAVMNLHNYNMPIEIRDNVSVIVVHGTHTHIMLLWYTCPTVSALE